MTLKAPDGGAATVSNNGFNHHHHNNNNNNDNNNSNRNHFYHARHRSSGGDGCAAENASETAATALTPRWHNGALSFGGVGGGCAAAFVRDYGLSLDIDLEGGTLLSVEEREEVDPEDNCRVQITCFHILSADKTEESTITKRRKLKVNCTQSLKRVEFSNGKESKVEERTTILDNVDALRADRMEDCVAAERIGGYPPLPAGAIAHHRRHRSSNASSRSVEFIPPYGDHSSGAQQQVQASGAAPETDEQIGAVLRQTQHHFFTLLNEKKEQLVRMFPDLFAELRQQPALFKPAASTVMETVVNADGSTTTHTKSSKAFSSHYTCHETYLNGVRQERSARFRAFMEYAGPEGGFRIRLNDAADEDEDEWSESEADAVDGMILPSSVTAANGGGCALPPPSSSLLAPVSLPIMGVPAGNNSNNNTNNINNVVVIATEDENNEQQRKQSCNNADDTTSHISRSGLSEIPDTSSALVVSGREEDQQRGSVPTLVNAEPASMRRIEKAWHAVNELVESEARYVQKLALLEKFREEVERDRLLDRRQTMLLFANIQSLYRFHNDHLLPQLMDRHREWQSTKKISDVMRKQAPFLKMYSEYTNNYKKATQMFEECARKKRHFEEIVRRMEQLPECENLSLVSHLICPVQRVMRYQLLLKEYQKHLSDTDVDSADTDAALVLVMEAASHANEMMRKLDRYRNVLEAQEQLGNSIALVSPSRELLAKVRLMKISSSSGKCEERTLFVFNDLILLVSERSSTSIGGIIGGGSTKYKLRAIFNPLYTQIYEGDNFEREHSFYIRGSDTRHSPARCVELYCASQSEKSRLIETFWSVIDDVQGSAAAVVADQSLQQPLRKDEEEPAQNSLFSFAHFNGNGNSVLSTVNNNNSSLSDVGSTINGNNGSSNKSCARCDVDFTWYSRTFICSRCARRFCKKCFGGGRGHPAAAKLSATLSTTASTSSSSSRCCASCSRASSAQLPNSGSYADDFSTDTNGPSLQRVPQVAAQRRNMLATPADNVDDTIKAGWVSFYGGGGGSGGDASSATVSASTSEERPFHRYFILRKNFCLYSYKTERDKCASAMMPMSGCDVTPLSSSSTNDVWTFTIRHQKRVYHVQCATEADRAEWMAALILSANATLPEEKLQQTQQQQLPIPKPVRRSASVGERVANGILLDVTATGKGGLLKLQKPGGGGRGGGSRLLPPSTSASSVKRYNR